jgi:protein SCO1/2
MMAKSFLNALLLAGALAASLAASSLAHAEDAAAAPSPAARPAAAEQGQAPAAAGAQPEKVHPSIPDVALIDQNGKPRHFYSDLVKGKIVVMNAIYTSCPGVCPVQTQILSRVQTLLGDRVGKEVQLISVSLDPVTDTPQRMKEYAEKFGAGPGWAFLTGPKPDVDAVLKAMDLYASTPAAHTPMASVGYEPGEVWMKMVSISAPEDFITRIDYVKSLGEKKAQAR